VTEPYRCVAADPPWPLKWSTPKTRVNGRGERHANGTRTITYNTMTVDEVAALGVAGPVAADCWLFLWAPDAFVIDGSAARVCVAWGFRPRRFFVWRKSGISLGTFPRPQHELCLVGTRGSPAYSRRNVGSVFDGKLVYERRGNSHARKHSAKPDAFYDLVAASAPGPRLEMFARMARPGWDGWGDEYPGEFR
jgi:N6-adenosine-specific RNA methylase IME4